MAPFDSADYAPAPAITPAHLARPASGHDRLRMLATFLDDVPPEKFDIGFYWCGTKGCAMGWAASIPSFRAAGWLLSDRDQAPQYQGYVSYDAASAFFGITVDEAYDLFSTCNPENITAQEVAANIRSLLERVST